MLAIDRDYLLQTLTDLVRINSVNPDLTPNAPGEAEIARYTADALRRLGLDVAIHEPKPGRPSVVGVLRGQGGGRSLMLNAHYDTVGVEGMAEPFSGAVRDGKLYGRGAYDMKASLAAQIAAAKALVDAGTELAGDLLIAGVADEEYGSIGTADLIGRYAVDAAIVTEPTALATCLAHKGFVWLEVTVWGRAAHGSRFDLGVDANFGMGRVLNRLDELAQRLQSGDGHPLVGPPSLHTGLLTGGAAFSVYPARATVQIERRTIPGETVSQVQAEIQAILDDLTAADSDFRAEVRAVFARHPFEAHADSEIVRVVNRAATDLLGHPPVQEGQTPWMDAALLAEAGVDTVVIGPAGAGAHADEEWVDVESVEKLAGILARAALDYCGLGGNQ